MRWRLSSSRRRRDAPVWRLDSHMDPSNEAEGTPWRRGPHAEACMQWADEMTSAMAKFRNLSLPERAAMMGGLEAGLRMGITLALLDIDWARAALDELDREVSSAAGLPSDAEAEAVRRLTAWERAKGIIDSSGVGS